MLRTLSRRNFSAGVDAEILALETKLAQLKSSRAASAAAPAAGSSDSDKFVIGTFNAISPVGLKEFPTNKYRVAKMETEKPKEPHAVLLRSHKLQSAQVPSSVRAIARCGSGVNNIPVEQMTLRGIPVFNTPGANANAVKELTICALLLSSRGVVEGIEHVKKIYVEDGTDKDKVKKRVEAEKKFFVGQEMKGKRLGVIGLGFIGASVAEVALNMGMNVIGYDPMLTVESAWKLPGDVMNRAASLEQLLETSDYISLHVPYSKNTHHMLSADKLKLLKKNCHIVNYARGELIDTKTLRQLMDDGSRTGRYVCDFPDENIQGHKLVTTMPHLGASTEEAEENAASMAAQEVTEFIETGQIRNSVNFPTTTLPRTHRDSARLCIVNRNVPGMLGLITSTVGAAGLNILQQMNTSRDQIAYNVVDLAAMPENATAVKLLEDLNKIEGVVSSRLIQPAAIEVRKPGYFVVNTGEE
ncbi:hypothetical protein BASA81_001692 [Batrachochytrium salamandrivorans]|nr:hypothetical protein BASA81_001692 [Batrachochytrium salamandrivorans]